jgi:hypothetical protein
LFSLSCHANLLQAVDTCLVVLQKKSSIEVYESVNTSDEQIVNNSKAERAFSTTSTIEGILSADEETALEQLREYGPQVCDAHLKVVKFVVVVDDVENFCMPMASKISNHINPQPLVRVGEWVSFTVVSRDHHPLCSCKIPKDRQQYLHGL